MVVDVIKMIMMVHSIDFTEQLASKRHIVAYNVKNIFKTKTFISLSHLIWA